MKKVSILLGFTFLLIFLSSCLNTLHPIFTEKDLAYDPKLIEALKQSDKTAPYTADAAGGLKESPFAKRNLNDYSSDIVAYHRLILDLVEQQYISTNRVLSGTAVKRIFVDGGFSKNVIFMNLLAAAFPELEVFAAYMAQATAVGAALAIHESWNTKSLPNDIIELKYYAAGKVLS